MEEPHQQVAETAASLSVDVKTKATTLAEPEPQLDESSSPTDDTTTSKKKKKKKKKNRRKSLEKTDVEAIQGKLKVKDSLKPEEEEGVSIEETTVHEEVSIEKETVVRAAKEEEEDNQKQDEAGAGDDELGPPSLERTSSLDTLKTTGTRAVGSLLSRFKVGRKKPLPSRTESTAKLDLVNPSPVKTAVKRLEVPDEKNLDDLPMRTKRDFFGEGEQSIHVSAEKDKYDAMEKQRRVENKTEEAAAAKHASSSSTKSSDEIQIQAETGSEEIQGASSLLQESPTGTTDSDAQELTESISADFKAEMPSEVTTSTLSEGITDETTKVDDATAIPAPVDEVESTVSVVETLREDTSITLMTNGSADVQVTTADVEKDNVSAPVTVNATEEETEAARDSPDVTKIEPVSLKLDLDLDLNTDATDATQNQVEVEFTGDAKLQSDEGAVEPFVTEAVEAAASNENAQSEAASTDETVAVEPLVTAAVEVVASNEKAQSEITSTNEAELLSVKVTPPTSELLAEAAAPAKPERMSPVKSLASRFEGKREQSLDNLKFRTVREFFPEERSIRVGAEKKKYEAQAQQQKLKAKAEEEAKSKYKIGSGFKSPDKEVTSVAPSPEFKATASFVQEAVVTGEPGAEFTTPNTAASRKKFSFDEGHAATNSPSKFSDDAQQALTPVKSIASRFEGKREQSLENLKFRTVREFFTEERSVRVGSEKQKFEAQAQHDKSLDNLKFRTVREFFPEEGKRSIHVGAEKAKFEALTKQQEEATKAAEQVKLKHAALSATPTTANLESFEVASTADATIETSSSTLDDARNETATSAAVGTSELKDDAVVEPAEESVEAVVVGGLSADNEAAAFVDKSPVETEASVILHSTDTESVAISIEDMLAASDVQGQAEETVDAAVVEPVAVSSENIETSEEAKELHIQQPEEAKFEQVADKAVLDVDNGLVELDLGDGNQEELADIDITEESHASKHANLDIEQTSESQEIVQEIEPKLDSELVERDLGETVVDKLVESCDAVTRDGDDVDEQVNSVQAETGQESVEVVEKKASNNELVELDFGEPVMGNQGDSSVSSISEGAIASSEVKSLDIEQPAENQEADRESQAQSAPSAENRLVELDLGEPVVEAPKEQLNHETKAKSRPMLTTERSFVIEDDHTIETEDTVVVGERPMTDGEDEFEPLSPTKARPAHELFAGITSSKSKKMPTKKTSTKASPKLTRKVSTGSVGSAKSPPAKTTVPVPMKRASITAPTASYMAKKAAEAAELHKASPQLKKKGSASKLKGTVSETGFIKPPPAAPTVPVRMKRASITAPTASWQARNVSDHAGKVSHSQPAPKTHASKPKGTVGPTGFVKPIPPPTVPVAPKRASVMAPTASYRAKKAAEHSEDIDAAVLSVPARNKKYLNVKSKVLDGIQSGSKHAVTHKTITKEEFIAAERRKSLGSAGVRVVLDVVDRRASLTARAAIDGPPEPFMRSALSRKKLNSTVPRYMNYENTPGYSERARQQYERRKRLEEENSAKSEKRQRELRTFFADKQQKSLMSSADEVRRGLEAHEFATLAKESEIAVQKALREERQRTHPTRSHHRASPATSSAGASSSNGVHSRTSKKSSVSSIAEKGEAASTVESTVVETEEVMEATTVVAEETVELSQEEAITEMQEVVIEAAQVDEQTTPVPVVDEDPALEHVAKKIDFDEASSDSDEKNVSNE